MKTKINHQYRVVLKIVDDMNPTKDLEEETCFPAHSTLAEATEQYYELQALCEQKVGSSVSIGKL